MNRAYYVITFFFLIISSHANFISKTDIFWFVYILVLLWVGIEKKLILKKDVNFFIFFTIAYLSFVFLRNIVSNHLSSDYLISDILFLFKYVLLTFTFCAILKDKAVEYLIKVAKDLTVISLFVYVLQLLGLRFILYNIYLKLNIFPSDRSPFPEYANFLFFTTSETHNYRNSGFVWEPGAFGCFLILIILMHFLRNKFTIDKTAKILMLGVVTTLSTTNYLALFIIFFLMYRYKVRKFNFMILLIIPVVAVLFVSLPFLGDKIGQTMDSDKVGLEDINNLSRWYTQHNEQIPLNRFASLTFIYNKFGPRLILGLSNKYDEIILQSYNVNISNGIIDYVAKFGLVGLVYLLYKFCRFCKSYLQRNELVIYCAIIFLILGFGEPILFLPLFISFIFLPIYNIDYEEFWNQRPDPSLITDPIEVNV